MDAESQAGTTVVTDTVSERPLDRKGASVFLNEQGYVTAPATLAKLASVGGGPQYRKFGRKPLYLSADLLQWAKSRCSAPRQSTSEPEQLTKAEFTAAGRLRRAASATSPSGQTRRRRSRKRSDRGSESRL